MALPDRNALGTFTRLACAAHPAINKVALGFETFRLEKNAATTAISGVALDQNLIPKSVSVEYVDSIDAARARILKNRKAIDKFNATAVDSKLKQHPIYLTKAPHGAKKNRWVAAQVCIDNAPGFSINPACVFSTRFKQRIKSHQLSKP
ncbi:hypothetical protein [Chromatium okenii]|uniref:Uncharacterized protein n=1 Tax=Chromatium okenii TaxID=61644 RepID=A0A2S7XT98_9GAMM|nr:hypothetical protein [Chromatium okenii]PQJ96763.1 hypothetical protein CXB77_06055 [Chromatium okenii]